MNSPLRSTRDGHVRHRHASLIINFKARPYHSTDCVNIARKYSRAVFLPLLRRSFVEQALIEASALRGFQGRNTSWLSRSAEGGRGWVLNSGLYPSEPNVPDFMIDFVALRNLSLSTEETLVGREDQHSQSGNVDISIPVSADS